MSRHAARFEFALCDFRDPDGRRCHESVVPEPQRDPMGPGAVLAGYLDVTNKAKAAGWDTSGDGDWCPAHKGIPMGIRGRRAIGRAEAGRVKSRTADVPLPEMDEPPVPVIYRPLPDGKVAFYE